MQREPSRACAHLHTLPLPVLRVPCALADPASAACDGAVTGAVAGVQGKDLRELTRTLDVNANGTVDIGMFQDLVLDVRQYQAPGASYNLSEFERALRRTIRVARKKSGLQLEELFRSFDVDQDGQVTRDEFRGVVDRLAQASPENKLVREAAGGSSNCCGGLVTPAPSSLLTPPPIAPVCPVAPSPTHTSAWAKETRTACSSGLTPATPAPSSTPTSFASWTAPAPATGAVPVTMTPQHTGHRLPCACVIDGATWGTSVVAAAAG